MSQAAEDGLAAFSDPASVAVVGASDDAAKWGHWLARGALAGEGRRRVYLVNGRADEVLGRPCYPSLGALPEVPELVALAVPAGALLNCVTEAADLGVAGLVSVTAGVEDEACLRRALAGSHTRLVGPNCLGIYDSSTDLTLAWGRFVPGGLAIVSQSGQLGLEIAGLAECAGIGVSRFVSVGSQLDVTAAEVLDALVEHEKTTVVALYLEGFGDGARTLAAIDRLRRAGKPVLVLTVGGSEAARVAARSHTGSMTSGTDVVDAGCRSVGAVRVDTPKQLVDAAALLVRSALPAGDRVAVITDGGGQGAIAADTAVRVGLSVAPLPEETRAGLAAMLPTHGSTANPVDLAGAGEQDLRVYGSLVAAVAGSGAVDAIVLSGYFGSYAGDVPGAARLEADTARVIGRAAAASGVPVVVHSMAASSPTIEVLREGGVATYHDIESALGAVAVAAAVAHPPVRTADRAATLQGPASGDPLPTTPVYGYFAARGLLAGAGVTFPPAVLVGPGEPIPVAAAIGFDPPYALKADWIAHKTELDAVAVQLADRPSLSSALQDMVARLGHGGYVVEQMDTRPDVIELIVAARRDPVFGPTVLVGAGGITAELDPDTALELAPCTPETARAMLERLRIWPLLRGWRGRPGVDVAGVVDTVVAASTALSARPDLAEIELNPVRAGAGGIVAVDALLITRAEGARPDDPPTENEGASVERLMV